MADSADQARRTNDDGSDLTVTVVGTAAGQGIFRYRDGGPDWRAPWAELPKVEILARATDSLGSVLERAAEKLGVSLTPGAERVHRGKRAGDGAMTPAEVVLETLAYAGFRRADDDLPGDGREGVVRRDSRARKHTVLVVRDSEGRAVWRRPPFTATMGELVDAAEVGLLEGDPLCPYLILVIPQGMIGLTGDWAQLRQELETIWILSGIVGQIAGALSFLGFVRRFAERHSDRGAKAVKRNSAAWAERGASPADLDRLLTSKPRTTPEVAALLGCPESEAEAILWAFGLVLGDNCLWAPKDRSRHEGAD
ncbi:MAG: hypothetical protein WB507_03190 [Solirubrobacterales bacterium]